MVELERRNVPTVCLNAADFVRDARRSAETFGLPQLPLAVVPRPFTNQSPDSIRSMVDQSIDRIVSGLTQEVPAASVEGKEIVLRDERWLTFEGEDQLEALDVMNRRFLEYGWSDGFPLRPPTERQVERMLSGASRQAESVVATLEPGFGIATAEMIAVNAVMAGCRPEHLPVVIAAVECLAEPKIHLRTMALSTGSHAPLILINGPIRHRLGINSGGCTLGPGAPSYANTVIGRAVRLCMMNIGHVYAGVSDMDTIGSPTKYGMCAGENEEASPWVPYHVEQGYAKEVSSVTVHFGYGICELWDFRNQDPERLIEVFATAAMNLAQVPTGFWLLGRRIDPRTGASEREHHMMFICPEHAQSFAVAGWQKQQIREAMHRRARLPFRMLMLNKEPKAMTASHSELNWLWDRPEALVPVLEDAGCYDIAVVGGAAGRGAFFYGAGEPVTRPINE